MSTVTPKGAPAGTAPHHQDKKPPPPAPKRTSKLLTSDHVALDVVINEQVENRHHQRQLALVYAQSVIIAILTGVLIFIAPFVQPVYHYYAVNPAGETAPLTGLTMPNMTNQAILSWTINSVTEVMTIGFGDYVTKLDSEKLRFTSDGWDSFVHEFIKQDIGNIFKRNQLVLTTVPSNVPVILKQGRNGEGVYEWTVQVPVIMTYTTNNNVTQRDHTIVTLTIVRVLPSYNPDGIAIKTWHVHI